MIVTDLQVYRLQAASAARQSTWGGQERCRSDVYGREQSALAAAVKGRHR